MTPDELKAQKDALLADIKIKVGEELTTRGYQKKDEVEALVVEKMKEFKDLPLEGLRSMADEKTGVMAMLQQQGAKIIELEKSGGNGKHEDLSIRSQVKQWAKDNEAAINKIKSGEKAELAPLQIRTAAASPMTPANTYNSSSYLPYPVLIPGVNEIVRPQPTFWDYLPKGTAGGALLYFVNKKNPYGAAGFIGPGVAKPGISFEIETQTSAAKKVAASEKVALEMLYDIEAFASWVEMELAYQVKQKVNTTLMSGASSSTVPAGIQSLSTTYTATGVNTTNPNNWDCLIACVAQLRSGNLMGPVTAFVNPLDYANMKLAKAISQGQPFIAPETGVTIVEDNNMTAGYVQVAILQYYKIAIWQGYTVTYGWENDDFTKNLITVLGEIRLHQYFSTNYTGAFIYDTFANIKTAITAV